MTNQKQEKLIQLAAEKGFELQFHDDIKEDRELHYWYGGTIVTFTEKETGETYELWANGDIWAKYYDEDGEEQVFVKDKQNSGNFYSEMMDDVKNDDHLIELASNWHEEKYPALEIENNNWFEVFSNYEDDRPNFEEVLEADKFSDAVEEALELIIEFKE